MNIRSAAGYVAYRIGTLDLLHRLRHRWHLTVIMFHRVLPKSEMIRLQADPLYTVTPQLLECCLEFLRRHYAIVSIEQVLSSLARAYPLPPWPALITFDDGWQDNLEWAMPVLKGVPWTLFVATDVMSEPVCWWQDLLLWALRSGRATREELTAEAVAAGAASSFDNSTPLCLLLTYASLTPELRRNVLAPYRAEFLRMTAGKPQMISVENLRALARRGVAIGSHGAAHLPLSELSDATADLSRARTALDRVKGISSKPAVSFPHGRYDTATIKSARDAGYKLLLTSDAVLNPCPGGWLQSDIAARIPIATQDVDGADRHLQTYRLARWLYLRGGAPPSHDIVGKR